MFLYDLISLMDTLIYFLLAAALAMAVYFVITHRKRADQKMTDSCDYGDD